jgi:hypothetical protein
MLLILHTCVSNNEVEAENFYRVRYEAQKYVNIK